MAFKLKPPYSVDNTPVYNRELAQGVLGQTVKNGSIIVNRKLNPKQIKKVIRHEKVHVDQFKRGDLDYDDKNFYWKGKKYPRFSMNLSDRSLPWEGPAYKKQPNV
jgi:hypothetical protein